VTYRKKDDKTSRKQLEKKNNYTGFLKSRNLKWTVIVAAIIIIIVVLAVTNPFFKPPQSISAGSYYKVSDSDLLSNGSSGVYFLSWIGCPIGATDSWAIYYGINSTENISSHVQLHTADPSDVYSNETTGQPGLLFTGDFSFTDSGHKVTFYPLYMYNETMSGTTANKPINGSLVSYGLSLVNLTYPSAVAAIFNKYASDISYDNHLTTTVLITGPHGSYIFNSYMYPVVSGGVLGSGTADHGDWDPHTPQYVMSHLGTATNVQSGATSFMEHIAKAQ
jgi:hypothetical protein